MKKAQALAAPAGELELGAFVRGLAHDIANPLNAMAMNAELAKVLLDRGDPAGSREVLERLLADCARCGRLVQSFQRFGAALQASSREPVDARVLIQNAIAVVKNDNAGNAIEFQIDGATDVLVLADSPALERAFAGLLQNAAEAGAHKINISLKHEHDHLFIQIADDGEGIQEKWRAKVTEPFFSTRRAQGASGLGLTLACELLRQHGGSLSVHSNPGEGTTIAIELPALPDH